MSENTLNAALRRVGYITDDMTAYGFRRMASTRLNEVLVAGGEDVARILTSAELYNPATGKWTATGSTKAPRIADTATVLPNGEVLVAGGSLGTDSQNNPILSETADESVDRPMENDRPHDDAARLPQRDAAASGQVLVAGGNKSVGSSRQPLTIPPTLRPIQGHLKSHRRYAETPIRLRLRSFKVVALLQ